jgi:D-alanyl-D-alanine carboxypeptidase (penicillin-binding protein 5/6)
MRLRLAFGLLVVAVLLVIQYLRPIPAVQPSPLLASSSRVPGGPPALPWPGAGGAAVGVAGAGVFASGGLSKPQPIASVAKVMTALVLLEDKPLARGKQGPAVTVSADDVADYAAKRDSGQSVVAVSAGEQLTQYQLLQGLLIPSGNNIADLIARWDTGSVASFVAKMNARAKDMGLKSTNFVDTSGFDAKTVSTPADLVSLGEAAVADPVLAEIVAQPQAELPVAGTVYNVDYALGQGGIGGIKTGSSPEAGACFLFSSAQTSGGKPFTIVGAIVGVPTLDDAFAATKALIKTVAPAVRVRRVVAKDQSVGRYSAPWGGRTDILATRDLDLAEWPGQTLRTRLEAPAVNAPLPAGSDAGDLFVKLGDLAVRVPLQTADPLFQPGNRWRLTRTDPLF